MALRCAIAEAEMKQAVAEGKITEKEAQAKLTATGKMMAGQGERADDMKRRIVGALIEAGIEREQIRAVMGARHRIIAQVQSEGDAFELDPCMLAHLEELGLTGEQITLVVGLSQRVARALADSNRGRSDARSK